MPDNNGNSHADRNSNTLLDADGDANALPNDDRHYTHTLSNWNTNALSNADRNTDANALPNANWNTDWNANGDSDCNTDWNANSDADAVVDAKPNSNTESNADTKPDGHAESNADTDSHTNAEGNSNANANTHTDAEGDNTADSYAIASTGENSDADEKCRESNPNSDPQSDSDTGKRVNHVSGAVSAYGCRFSSRWRSERQPAGYEHERIGAECDGDQSR